MLSIKRSVAFKNLLEIFYSHWQNPKSCYRDEIGYCMSPQEAIFLHSLMLLEKPEVIFESGTALGWSAAWMSLVETVPVYTYDVVKRPELFTGNFKRVIGSFSKNVKTELQKWKHNKKMILIDGGHEDEEVMEDFYAVEPFLQSGDVIIFHDSGTEIGVQRALKRLERLYKNWTFNYIKTVNGMAVIKCM